MRRLGALLGAAVTVTGCSGGVEALSVPNPPAVTAAVPSPGATFPAGLSTMPEAPVAGVTTTTLPPVGPGPAALAGTVVGPAGPVAGAVVQIDRFVGTDSGDATASSRSTAGADGSWSFPHILGGRYRVRAWLAPDLDMATPDLLFLAASQPQQVTPTLTKFPDPLVQSAIDPSQPVQGQPANLVVQVTRPSIDGSGVESSVAVPGSPVTLVDGPAWRTTTPNPLATDPSGQAVFTVVCTRPGSDPLSAQIGSGTPVAIQLPDCAPAPVTTTTTVPGPPASTATTTCPPAGTATTTTLDFGSAC